jgi:hypothetical protein
MTSTNVLISIPDFLATEPFGRTRVYEMLDSGLLESVCVGRRRMIVADSYRRYVEQLKAESNGKRRPSPNPKAASYAGPGGHPPPATRGAKGKRRVAR